MSKTRQSNFLLSLAGAPSSGGGGGGMVDPQDAPDSDFLWNIDWGTPARTVEDTSTFTKVYTSKAGSSEANNYFGSVVGLAPLSTNTLNSLPCATFENLGRRTVLNATADAAIEMQYTDYTIFMAIQPRTAITQGSFIISDYGDTLGKLLYFKLGDGSTLIPSVHLRDTDNDNIIAQSATALSLNTTYMLVGRFNGTSQTCDYWLDGGVRDATDTDATYDNTTTFEGKATASSIPTIGALSNTFNAPFDGYLGQIFVTKTALSLADINAYGSFMADRWGTTWTTATLT